MRNLPLHGAAVEWNLMEDDLMKTVGYCRVSTKPQHLSLKNQQDTITKFTINNNLDLLDIITEVKSSKKLQDTILHLLGLDFKFLVVSSLDRLCRSNDNIETILNEFKENGKYIISIKENINSSNQEDYVKFIQYVNLYDEELKLISKRTSDVLGYLKRNNKSTGVAPYGFYVGTNGTLVKNQNEQNIIRLVKNLRMKRYKFREIVKILGEKNIVSRKNKPFGVASVHSMVMIDNKR